MATIYQTFGGATNDQPPGWAPALVGTGAAFGVSGGALALTTGTGFNGGTAVYDQRIQPAGRLTGLVNFDSLTNFQCWFGCQIGGTDATVLTEGYRPAGFSLKLEPESGTIEVSHQPGVTVLSSVTGITYANMTRFEFIVQGNVAMARTWPDSSPIPPWQIITSDPAPALGDRITIGWKNSNGVNDVLSLYHLQYDELNGSY